MENFLEIPSSIIVKTKILKNDNIKAWYNREEEFTIGNKNEPLYDNLIDGYVLEKKYSKIFLKEVNDAGLDKIHGIFIDIDDSFEDKILIMENLKEP